MKYVFAQLRQLFGGYFNQDWDTAGSNDADVILEFCRSTPPVEIEATLSELDFVLRSFAGDTQRVEMLLSDLGCEYYYQADGLNGEEWLIRVKSLLSGYRDLPSAVR